MPEYLAPGVYVEERAAQPEPIDGVPTTTAGFIGPCHKGPIKRAIRVTSLAGFERTYGSGRRLLIDGGTFTPELHVACRPRFKEGGHRLYVARVPHWRAHDYEDALKRLETIEEISIVAAPGSTFGSEHGGEGTAIANALIDKGTQWAVFEPNGEPLWAKIRRAVHDFLTNEWRAGGLPGSRPEEAFFVKCDHSTMMQADLDQGRLICLVGVALVRPAEFVTFRIGQWTADRPPF